MLGQKAPVLPARLGSITAKLLVQQHIVRPRAERCIARSLLGLKGCQHPRDIGALAEGVCTHSCCCYCYHCMTPGLSLCMVPPILTIKHVHCNAGVSQNLYRSSRYGSSKEEQAAHAHAQQQLQAVCSCLEFINTCHPDSRWQEAAQEALNLLSSTAVYVETAAAGAGAAAAATAHNKPHTQQNQLTVPKHSIDPAALYQLLKHAEQLHSWVTELLELQAATAGAAVAIAHDPDCSPTLLLDAAAAEAHPVWAKDYAVWSAAAAAPGSSLTKGSVPKVSAAFAAQLDAGWCPEFELPAQSELHVGQGGSLNIQRHYRAAAEALLETHASVSPGPATTVGSADASSSSVDSSSSNSVDSSSSSSQGLLQWPLTASGTKVLLGTPLGVLPGPVLHQVYCLGLVGRVLALADAVDLARLVGREVAATQVGGLMYDAKQEKW